ncbi:MAG: rRNA maturation RNase YbeY [Helicobacteraceae bacterium]|nr:rRNA maturation RNase YbeY [Candidatus Sulfurimonas ponti]MBL6972809.1 rRNA maturation RNase YbeY [Sulfurimonas sp.]
MIEFDNRTSFEVNISLLEKISDMYTQKDIELILTTDDEIREINKQHRNIDRSTDVLSFPYEDMPMSPIGSIVISLNHVHKVAKSLKHSDEDELTLLFIHGLLHLLGFDHEVDKGEMRQEELQIIQKLKLPESLIIRTQG